MPPRVRRAPVPPPAWRALIASTAALFLVLLAFLAGRMRAGADPALGAGTASPAARTTPQVRRAPVPSGDDAASTDDSSSAASPSDAPRSGSDPNPPTTRAS
jgi:hypothetical protein